MRSKPVLAAATLAASLVCSVGAASAQSVLTPGNSSSHQYIDAESPTVQSDPVVFAFRPTLRFMGLTMFWSRSAWIPASPIRMPSMLAVTSTGDRRWGLR